MFKAGLPNLVDVEQGFPALVHVPSFQGMYNPSYSPSAHNFSRQPILYMKVIHKNQVRGLMVRK